MQRDQLEVRRRGAAFKPCVGTRIHGHGYTQPKAEAQDHWVADVGSKRAQPCRCSLPIEGYGTDLSCCRRPIIVTCRNERKRRGRSMGNCLEKTDAFLQLQIVLPEA